jgi:hypothetical protein
MRALLKTVSTSHFFVCKVWIFRSFKGGVIYFYAFDLGFKEFKGLHKAGLQERGGIILTPPPLFLPGLPPTSRNNLIF